MTNEERSEKLQMVELLKDRVEEIQKLIAEKEDENVEDDDFFRLLLELEELTSLL